jgi:hypothetical protein
MLIRNETVRHFDLLRVLSASLLHPHLDNFSLTNMVSSEECGMRTRNVSRGDTCWRDHHGRVAYNQRVSQMRISEYPMLEGM